MINVEADTPLDFVRVFDHSDNMVLSMTITETQWLIKDLESALAKLYLNYFDVTQDNSQHVQKSEARA